MRNVFHRQNFFLLNFLLSILFQISDRVSENSKSEPTVKIRMPMIRIARNPCKSVVSACASSGDDNNCSLRFCNGIVRSAPLFACNKNPIIPARTNIIVPKSMSRKNPLNIFACFNDAI